MIAMYNRSQRLTCEEWDGIYKSDPISWSIKLANGVILNWIGSYATIRRWYVGGGNYDTQWLWRRAYRNGDRVIKVKPIEVPAPSEVEVTK